MLSIKRRLLLRGSWRALERLHQTTASLHFPCNLPFPHFASFMLVLVFPVDPVEDVTAQRVAFRQVRVVEVSLRIMNHAELFHDPAGALVLRDGE